MTAACGLLGVGSGACLPVVAGGFLLAAALVGILYAWLFGGGSADGRADDDSGSADGVEDAGGEDEDGDRTVSGRLRAVPWGQVLLVAVGMAAVGLGVVARVAPAAVPSALSLSALPFDARPVHVVIAGGWLLLLVTVSAEWLGVRRRTTDSGGIGRDVTEAVRIEASRESVADPGLRETLETLGDRDLARAQRIAAGERLQGRLRSTAVATLVHVDGQDPATARDRVAGGTWTERRDVAAFLGGVSAPRMPLRYRLLDWLSGEPAALRRGRRAVVEIERLGGTDGRPGGDAP